MKICGTLILTFLVFHFFCIGQHSLPFERAQPTKSESNYAPIVDTSKLWSVHIQGANMAFSMYYKIGDTITLNGNIYRSVFETNDSLLLSWTLVGFIRESNNSEVYFRYTNGDEGLIYKFDLEVNDSVEVYNPLVCPEYNTLVVSEIDSIWLGNIFRKRIYFLNSNNEDYWTEGIGSKFGLLFSNYCYIGVLYNLICYYEFDTLIYQNPDFENCYYPLIDNVNLNKQSKSFQVKYNTSDRTIAITNSNVKTGSIAFTMRIFNLLGNEIYYCKLFSNPQIISVSHFAKGLYLVNINSQGNLLYQEKIFIY